MSVQEAPPLDQAIALHFGDRILAQETATPYGPSLWVRADAVPDIVRHLKEDIDRPFPLMADLYAVDETARPHPLSPAAGAFTLVHHLISPERNQDIVLKSPLPLTDPVAPSLTQVFPCAGWYEREAFDQYGIRFDGHPGLRRILNPASWTGHPLRKDHYARATEAGPFELTEDLFQAEEAALAAEPALAGLAGAADGQDLMVLNLGPNHPSAHGVFRVAVALDGEEIVDARPEIGFHHRGVEKMAERQTWHGFIPYCDRVDYLGGVTHELPYLMAVEQLCGIAVPPRAQMIRVMLTELFRIQSHLVFYGTMSQDVGMLSPVFYMFRDRERGYELIESVTGARMHPGWFRIGGVAADLPPGWDTLLGEFIPWMRKRLHDYDRMVLKNRMFKARTVDIGTYTTEQALAWGVTGPGLRATGMAWDLRKARPYSGYDQLEFDVPVGHRGDSFDRTVVRVEEMHQSLRILEQCLAHMPDGPIKADHPLTTPPPRERMLHDIETLIHHFIAVSWGPRVPAGEALGQIESARGLTQYAIISDGDSQSYRTRIRSPSFAHLQMIPALMPGLTVADLVAVLGSIDFIMSDVDR